ncbi:MAG TPA: hypothetical protein VLZ33_04800 [Dysgonamonadaceae bacterium]|nr:hypothetical protein [Dysgonamonadaceae bacterium]
MKSLLKHTLFKRLLILAVIFIILLVLFLFATTLKAKSFKVNDDITEIYLGDSHVRYAINDKLLTHSLNLGNSSESTYLSYFKLRQILNKNPNIKKLNLGFSYHNISKYYDDYTFGKYSNSVAPNYFYILPYEEQLKMMKRNFKRVTLFLAHVLKSGIKSWFNKNTFEGGYENSYTDVVAIEASMDERLKLQYYTSDKLQSFSLLNITYFNKIVELCKDKNIKLVLLNTPMHSYYRPKVPKKFTEKYNSIVSSKNLKVIDLTRLEMSVNCYQPDGDLVSKQGALETTKEIVRLKNQPANL